MVIEVLFYSSFFIIAYNLISYNYNQDFFVFSDKDAMVYHLESLKIIDQKFWTGINYFLRNWLFEDLGIIIYISFLYKIVASNLIVNFANMLIGVFTSVLIFRIGKKFMSIKYSYICALSYSVSSFVLWFHSSGLKESLMIFFIVVFFDQYYEFMKRNKVSNIFFMILSLVSIFFFRPVIIFIIIFSVLASLLILRRKTSSIIVLILLSITFIFFSSGFFEIFFDQFVGSEGRESLLETRRIEGMIKISLPFTIATNFIASLFGPFPSIIPDSNIILSFYSPGLIFRVLLSFSFWTGVYYAYKNKLYTLFPLIFFVILEGFSLSYILEGLELRKSLPHFFAIFLVSFWFLDFFNAKNFFNLKSRKKIIRLLEFSTLIFLLLMLIWNLKAV